MKPGIERREVRESGRKPEKADIIDRFGVQGADLVGRELMRLCDAVEVLSVVHDRDTMQFSRWQWLIDSALKSFDQIGHYFS